MGSVGSLSVTLPQPHPCLIDKGERVMSVCTGGGLFIMAKRKKKDHDD